jgi:hypothetical protein
MAMDSMPETAPAAQVTMIIFAALGSDRSGLASENSTVPSHTAPDETGIVEI